jgi:hypothetical protein
VNREITPADVDNIDTLNYIIRIASGVLFLCVAAIAHIEGFL